MTPAPPTAPWPRRVAQAALLAAVLALAACTSAPKRTAPASSTGGAPVAAPAGRDGPPLDRSVDPLQVPDAEPRVEPIRQGGPNKPYEVGGQTYVPAAADVPLAERGLASWYGRLFHGRRTASGEVYDMNAMTAAHRTMPIPSYARVRNPANGREVVVRVNDRGPFAAGRVIDLSYAAAVKLGVQNGVTPVEVERITHDEIRAGLATRPREPALAAVAPTAVPANVPVPPAPQALPATAAPVPLAEAPAVTVLPPTAGPGPAPVEPGPAPTPAVPGFWLQLGAFAKGEGAYSFQKRVAAELDWLAPLMTVFAEGRMYRLQAGPFPSREQARETAERLRAALKLVPLLVERR